MPEHPDPRASATPVFNDPTGRRASVLRRAAWAACGVFALAVGAIAFTLVTQVPLPGLGGLLPTPPESAPRVTPAEPAERSPAPSESSDEAATLTTAELETRLDEIADRARHDRNRPAGGSAESQPAPAATGADSSPEPAASGTPGTPSENAAPQATTKVRNPNAAPKKPSPAADKPANEHAATGHGQAAEPGSGADTAPGRNK